MRARRGCNLGDKQTSFLERRRFQGVVCRSFRWNRRRGHTSKTEEVRSRHRWNVWNWIQLAILNMLLTVGIGTVNSPSNTDAHVFQNKLIKGLFCSSLRTITRRELYESTATLRNHMNCTNLEEDPVSKNIKNSLPRRTDKSSFECLPPLQCIDLLCPGCPNKVS